MLSHRHPKNHPRPLRFAMFFFQINDIQGDFTVEIAVERSDAMMQGEQLLNLFFQKKINNIPADDAFLVLLP
jgi:hypothetical protein